MNNIKVVKELVKIAKSLIAEQNIANQKGDYNNFTGIIQWGKSFGTVTDAYFSLVNNGIILFDSGIWENGTWEQKDDNSGYFQATWKNGIWKAGFFGNQDGGRGIWENGTWYNGCFAGERWENGQWKNGQWSRGIWENGTWYDGMWCGQDPTHVCIWNNGTWKNGIWCGGVWNGGNWQQGYDVRFIDGKDYDEYHGRNDSPDKWDK